jgi:futalosine hydrolase
MNYLVVAATAVEIAPFLAYYRTAAKKEFTGDVLITGIGLTATTYHLAKQIAIKKPDFIIQAGVGGSFNTAMKLGSVVAVKQDTIADQSVVELSQLKSLFNLQMVPHNQYPYKKGWLINSNAAFLKKTKLKQVRAISVNEITTSKKKITFYEEAFDPMVESMEGAALHYVCLMEKIPFLQIRSISNYIGERNKKNWNMKESIINLNKALIEIINKRF